MTSLSALNLLRVWEEGRAHIRSACLAFAGERVARIRRRLGRRIHRSARCTITRPVRRLVRVELQSITHCPACDEALETNFVVADVRGRLAATVSARVAVTTQGFHITYRFPTATICWIIRARRAEDAELRLMRRCVTGRSRRRRERERAALPEAVVARLGARWRGMIPATAGTIALARPARALADRLRRRLLPLERARRLGAARLRRRAFARSRLRLERRCDSGLSPRGASIYVDMVSA